MVTTVVVVEVVVLVAEEVDVKVEAVEELRMVVNVVMKDDETVDVVILVGVLEVTEL